MVAFRKHSITVVSCAKRHLDKTAWRHSSARAASNCDHSCCKFSLNHATHLALSDITFDGGRTECFLMLDRNNIPTFIRHRRIGNAKEMIWWNLTGEVGLQFVLSPSSRYCIPYAFSFSALNYYPVSHGMRPAEIRNGETVFRDMFTVLSRITSRRVVGVGDRLPCIALSD